MIANDHAFWPLYWSLPNLPSCIQKHELAALGHKLLYKRQNSGASLILKPRIRHFSGHAPSVSCDAQKWYNRL